VAKWDTPRDPTRIPHVLDELRQTWELLPDMRLGQLITNAARMSDVDISMIEETDLLNALHRLRAGRSVCQPE
jgi:hypothetical protein